MNDREELQIKCQVEGHTNIQLACLNQTCKINRIYCHQCLINGDHVAHIKDQRSINQVIELFHSIEIISEDSIQELNQMITQINELFTQIAQELRNRYQISLQKLKTLNPYQFNMALNEIINYDQNEKSVQQETKQQLDNMIDLFNDWLNRLNIQKQEKSELLYQQGYQLYSEYHKYQEAIQLFDDALLINPKHFNSLYLKADSLRMLDNYIDAIIWVDKALFIDSKHVSSFYTKGESLRMLSIYDQAIKYLDQALYYNPNHHQSLGSKGACLQSLQQYQEAIYNYNKAIEIDPNYTWAKDRKIECESSDC
ncbi:unnamed protein product [Paramecium octaurelia]|uniref:Tetratricopeptide repeat protein n=1 Tax=Paramecium octaurelia TaxID=43137 RepID=A0A8S1WBL9_PAROT|nr:unnamed protein product [Paramecium octaurelia]